MAAEAWTDFVCWRHGLYFADCQECADRAAEGVRQEREKFLALTAEDGPLWALEPEPEDDHLRIRYAPISAATVFRCSLFATAVIVLMLMMAAAGCGLEPVRRPTPPPADPAGATMTTVSAAPAPVAQADLLAQVAVSDTPSTGEPYRRDLWPHWNDPDGNGCDAREDALIVASTVPVVRGSGCKVTAGSWTSAYDGLVITDPGAVDVDHVVPLAEAHRSGGSTWSTDRRAAYANAQASLWPVSASSNRSKGDKDPAQWRPPVPTIWCTYATRWLQVKAANDLTMDTPERDALGEMLSTC